eukprot:5750041-Ditylum_brightwellii.AAC.2
MKVIWSKCLVPPAEKHNFLSPVQFGNRQVKTSLDALLLRIVTMDSISLFHLNSAVLNNDTKACYDRTIPEITSLHLQSLGLPPAAIKCSVFLNKNMSHFVKMSEGLLTESYKHTDAFAK